MDGKPINASLLAVQRDLKVPKNQHNSFGKYNYRSCEDILEAAKPICIENGAILTCDTEVRLVGARFYIEATARLTDIATGDSIACKGYAREPETKKGMDESQITGTAESYAKKRALGNLFSIDDTKDADTDEYARQNAAGASKNGNAGTYSRQGVNGAQTGTQEAKTANDKASAVRALNAEMQRTGASGADVKAIAEAHLHKSSVNDMTPHETALLAKNLETWLAEAAGA